MSLENADFRISIGTAIIDQINEYAERTHNDGHRKHLGGSVIGTSCARQLWYAFRWFAKPFHEGAKNGQLMRLFNRGHREEESIVSYLQGIGCKFEQTQDQQLRISDCGGHFGGSLDNTGYLPEHFGVSERIFFEFKTANEASFRLLQKDCVQIAQPKHWAQICTYGYKTGIDYCLYVAVNKNNDELHVELLKVDRDFGEIMIRKAELIVYSITPPQKISLTPTNFACKWCNFKNICHYNEAAEINCRSCDHSRAVENGQWYCEFHKGVIPEDFIPKGCPSHVQIPVARPNYGDIG